MTEPRIEPASDSSRRDEDGFHVLLVKNLDAFYESVLNDEWDVHVAEDVVQETLLLAIENGGKLRDPGKLHAWLNAIRRRVGIRTNENVRRKEKHGEPFGYQKMSDMHETSKSGDPALVVAEREEREKEAKLLKEGYRSLPLKLRQVFSRYYRQGLSEAEIAVELDISIKTVKRRLKQIEKRLSKYMLRMIVAYMSFELSTLDTKAMAAQALDRALQIHNAQSATATTAVTTTGTTATVAESTGFSLGAALLHLGMALLSLLSLLLGGQLFGEHVVRAAPTLRARRWLVRKFLFWHVIVLSMPLIHGLLWFVINFGFKITNQQFTTHYLHAELVIFLGTAVAFITGVFTAYFSIRKFSEDDTVDGGFESLQHFVRTCCSVSLGICLLNFGVYAWLILSPNIAILFHPGIDPVKFGYLTGTLGIFGVVLAYVYRCIMRCFGRLTTLANDVSSLPKNEEPVSETVPGTWRTEAFFVAPFAAFPALANINHLFYRQTHCVYSAVELIAFTIWWYFVLRINIADTTFRWPRIVVSIVIQLFIMWLFRCLLGS